MDKLIAKYIGSTVRHGLVFLATFAGTYVELKPEVVAPFVDSTTALVSAVAVGLVSLAWSYAEKRSKTIFLLR